MSDTPAVIIAGNPSDGWEVIGPFESFDDAADFCENVSASFTWVVDLAPARKFLPTVG